MEPVKEMMQIDFSKLSVKYLHCMRCGKQVSSAYIPIPNEVDQKDIVVRAFIECPECIEKERK